MNTAATVNDASLADADPQDPAVQPTNRLQRWRLVLGQPAEGSCGGLGAKGGSLEEMDKALAALYEEDNKDGSLSRRGGRGNSSPSVARWLGDIIFDTIPADGLGIYIDGQMTLSGLTPDEPSFAAIVSMLNRTAASQVYTTDSIARIMPEALAHADRAAGLPDSPQLIGEPVRWPLLVRGQIDQGPQAALEYVQSFVGARLEEQEPCSCLWLVGLPAIRFAGEATADAYNRELQVEGLGAAWALPGLELLMDEPERKRELWQAMRRVRQRWLAAN